MRLNAKRQKYHLRQAAFSSGTMLLLFSIAAFATADTVYECAGLSDLTLSDTVITTSEIHAPGFTAPPQSIEFLPADVVVDTTFCRVVGVIAPEINFEVWLPLADAWNGRLHAVGNAGMAGSVNYQGIKRVVEGGYVGVSSDLGHQGGPLDGTWAIGRPDLVHDWGYRATHEMTVTAKSIITAYYGEGPAYSYFNGCSGGGRQGLMAAQRYPKDYDGILVGNPTIDFTRLVAGGRLWQVLSNLDEANEANYLTEDDIELISAAVLARCDTIDGVKDGVLEDPRLCDFDPAMIQCKSESEQDCLTAQQVKALRKIYAGAFSSDGEQIYPGYEPGGELGEFGWATYFAGDSPFESIQWIYAKGFLQGLVFENTEYDPLEFNFDDDIRKVDNKPILGETLAEAINAADPDLRKFYEEGGRLIHYHGWSDIGVAPRRSVQYYESVIRNMSESQEVSYEEGVRVTQKFYRLFMIPGMQHCFGGPGPNAFGALYQPHVPADPDQNIFKALEGWVEEGVAPDRIIATKFLNDHPAQGVKRTRPLCTYPKTARYKGSGSMDAALNFACD